MNRRHDRAGPPPQHAVAGHVQDIETERPQKAREFRLVPEDISHGRPEFFGDDFDLRATFGEGEKRPILREDKQGQLRAIGPIEQGTSESKDILGNARLAALDETRAQADFHAASPSKNSPSFAIRTTRCTGSLGLTKRKTTPCWRAMRRTRTMKPSPALSRKLT